MNQYVLGRGEIDFSRFRTGGQDPEGFRYIGNTPEFNLTIESENLDHFNSDRGVNEKDASIVLTTNRSGSLMPLMIQTSLPIWTYCVPCHGMSVV